MPCRVRALVFVALVGCGGRTTLDDGTIDPVSVEAVSPCGGDPSVVATLASSQPGSGQAIAVGGGEVYWTIPEGPGPTQGSVREVSRCGGDATVVATSSLQPSAIVVGSADVYWGNYGLSREGSLVTIAGEGEPPTQIWSGGRIEGQLALDATNVYWGSFAGARGLWKAPRTGGVATTLVSGVAAASVAVDDTYAFVMQPPPMPGPSEGELVRYSLALGTSAALSSDVLVASPLALDDANVYYLGAAGIRRVSKTAGSSATLANGDYVGALAIDGSNLYAILTSEGSGTLVRVPVDGGASTTLAAVPLANAESNLAVDDAYVYWTEGPEVKRVGK
jgi:hypothetical protein